MRALSYILIAVGHISNSCENSDKSGLSSPFPVEVEVKSSDEH
jgi:hypothetical protein